MNNTLHEQAIFRYSLPVGVLGSIGLCFWDLSVGLSFFLGSIVGSLAFRLLCLDAYKVLRSDSETGPRIARRGYFKRLLLYGCALTISIRGDYLVFGWTLLGLLVPKLMIYVLLVIRRMRCGIKCAL